VTGETLTSHQSYSAQLVTDEATAQCIMDAAAEALPDVAVSMVAQPDGRWLVELHFVQSALADAVRKLVRDTAGRETGVAVLSVAARDWIKASLEGLQPVPAGRFVVHGRHDRARIAPNRLAIEVEAALAFGTGHHGTTRGCLLAFDLLLKRERPQRVLDIGTGSGVLAMAAAKALRRRVLATDIDRAAVTVARDNARLNRTAALVTVAQGAGLISPHVRTSAPYDLIFANILLAPLKGLARSIARVLAPGGRAILSGLLRQQASAALAVYAAQGLRLERRVDLDGWATLVIARAVARPQPGP
jgi:ribosomal protein L11 methyltransferase